MINSTYTSQIRPWLPDWLDELQESPPSPLDVQGVRGTEKNCQFKDADVFGSGGYGVHSPCCLMALWASFRFLFAESENTLNAWLRSRDSVIDLMKS